MAASFHGWCSKSTLVQRRRQCAIGIIDWEAVYAERGSLKSRLKKYARCRGTCFTPQQPLPQGVAELQRGIAPFARRVLEEMEAARGRIELRAAHHLLPRIGAGAVPQREGRGARHTLAQAQVAVRL